MGVRNVQKNHKIITVLAALTSALTCSLWGLKKLISIIFSFSIKNGVFLQLFRCEFLCLRFSGSVIFMGQIIRMVMGGYNVCLSANLGEEQHGQGSGLLLETGSVYPVFFDLVVDYPKACIKLLGSLGLITAGLREGFHNKFFFKTCNHFRK